MQVQFDCYKCILNQIVEMAKRSSVDDRERRQILKQFITLVAEHAENSTPPEMASYFYDIYCRKTGVDDPYAEVKHLSTVLAQKLYPEMAALVTSAADPFAMAVKLAIGGNVIDFGSHPDYDLADAAAAIRETADLPVDDFMLRQLRERAADAVSVFYILDNCGEAVLDRLLIEQIGAGKVTLGVRGKPILNDVTSNELAASGLGDLPVIDTGDRAPGVSLRHSAPEFLEMIRRSDLVIAKGQGNFESLGDADEGRNIFFLFRVKCPVIREQTGAEAGSLQIRCRIYQN